MLRKFILFLIRRRLGLKKNERFRFANQRSKLDYYFFTEDTVKKPVTVKMVSSTSIRE